MGEEITSKCAHNNAIAQVDDELVCSVCGEHLGPVGMRYKPPDTDFQKRVQDALNEEKSETERMNSEARRKFNEQQAKEARKQKPTTPEITENTLF